MSKIGKKLLALLFLGLSFSMMAIAAQANAYSDADIVKAVQEKLNEEGFECGTADGIAGSKTTEAIWAYQEAHSLTKSGEIDDELLGDMGLAAAKEEEMTALDAQAENECTEENQEEADQPSADEPAILADQPSADEPAILYAAEDGSYALLGYIPGEDNIVYNNKDVIVTAVPVIEMLDYGQTNWLGIQYEVQNHSENPVIMSVMDLAVNDITVKASFSGLELLWWEVTFNLDMCTEEEFNTNEVSGTVYVGPGESGTKFIHLYDKGVVEFFGYKTVEKLETAVAVIGLTKELAFDGSEVSEEDILYTDGGVLAESRIPGSEWSGTEPDMGGTVIYEDDQICLTDFGIADVSGDSAYFDLVVKNKSDQLIGISNSDEGIVPVLNGQEAEAFANSWVLPRTRDYFYLKVSKEGAEIAAKEDVEEASCVLEVLDKSLQAINTIDYIYGDAAVD